MDHAMYPATTRELHQKRRELAPDAYAAFRAFSQAVFADGALPAKTKQLIAVAVAHVTQCPYCITGHTKLARRRAAREHNRKRSWRRSGSRPRCGPGGLRPFDAGHARPGRCGRRTIRRTGRSAAPRAREKGVMTRAPEQPVERRSTAPSASRRRPAKAPSNPARRASHSTAAVPGRVRSAPRSVRARRAAR